MNGHSVVSINFFLVFRISELLTFVRDSEHKQLHGGQEWFF
jgi:hypothetical protein